MVNWRKGVIDKMEKKIINLMAEILEVDETDLTLNTILDDKESWDSMAKLSLIVVVSDEFNKKLTSSEIKDFHTIGDIVKFVKH